MKDRRICPKCSLRFMDIIVENGEMWWVCYACGVTVIEELGPRGPQDVLRTLPTDSKDRKDIPVCTGVLDYFPLAIAEVARVSKAGNDQHNPGQPLHWARGKSSDHADCIPRHLIERGTRDIDGQRHTAKLAWRALALLQEELEAEAGFTPKGDA